MSQKHLILPFQYIAYVAVGCEIDSEKMELLLSQLSGKDITELIAAGREKFASVPCGGGGVAVAAAAPAAGGAAPAAEAKKEEKVEEKEESDDVRSLPLLLIPSCFVASCTKIMWYSVIFKYTNRLDTTFGDPMPCHLNFMLLCRSFLSFHFLI